MPDGIWHMTADEKEAEVALHLGNHVLGERIEDIIPITPTL
jgi:hypothetical protein